MLLNPALTAQDSLGSIRGIVFDKDFDVPLGAATVTVVETGASATSSDQGHFRFPEVAPGTYTLVFSKEGFVRQVRTGVVVTGGRLTDVEASLAGDVAVMEEFVVQDALGFDTATETGLLSLRIESPSFLDSIGSDLMRRAGAGDAASALRLVSGATIQDGKFAVIRGLPDRYVSSQLNGVRLPSADEDTRAVELDQFPSAAIDSIQVSKTFTPDQQGDASGGAVDVRLKRIPDEPILQFKTQVTYDDQATGIDDFLTYKGGGVNTFGKDSSRKIQRSRLGSNWEGAAGVIRDDAPLDYEYKLSGAMGGKREVGNGVRLGGYASAFYERDTSFFDNGKDDSWWVLNEGEQLVPQVSQGGFKDDDKKTALFDITRGQEKVQWGGLGTVGLETDEHEVALTYLYTHTAEDEAILAEDTRGKRYFFPGYNPNDPSGTGNDFANLRDAPYLRNETLIYTEREVSSLQLSGRHVIAGSVLGFEDPVLDWTLSENSALFDQPDKRLFGSFWTPSTDTPFDLPATWFPLKADANFTQGNFQRIFKRIKEDGEQLSANLKLPFEQWGGEEGYLKVGYFDDSVDRSFRQQSFSNFNETGSQFEGDWEDYWSAAFPYENHPITAAETDIPYDGEADIDAWYYMLDLPVTEQLKLIGGARYESTSFEIRNHPESEATWFVPGEITASPLVGNEADVDFQQDDILPSIGAVYEVNDSWTVRGSYTETVARQTFKELTPTLQQEFLGGPIFIGNPELGMSSLKNYDLRVDYVPYEGGLVSLTWFKKDIDDPIEFVQRLTNLFDFTTAVNYPEGQLDGLELELRQSLAGLGESFEGISVGANATTIDSEVTLPKQDAKMLADVGAPTKTRDMSNAPEYLYNLFLTYDIEQTGTQMSVFYTVRGDTLVVGGGVANNNFVPDVYAKEFGTLNFTASQRLSDRASLQFQAKNLTNPRIEEVYRSDFTRGDTTRSSFTAGREFSLSLSVAF